MINKVTVALMAFVASCPLIYPASCQSAEGTNVPGGTNAPTTYDSTNYDDHGTAEWNHGDLDDGIKDSSRAIQLNTNDAYAYGLRGLCFVGKNDFDDAIQDFNRSIVLNPTNAEMYLNRSTTYRLMGDFDKALRDLGSCLLLSPTNAVFYKARASLYGSKGEVVAELADWNSALKLDANDATALAYRGNAYFKMGQFDRAIEDYHKAVKANPDCDVTYNNLAWLRATCPVAEMRNGREAVELAKRACSLANWRNPDWVDTLAAAYAEVGDFDRAIEYEKEALDMVGNSKSTLAGMRRRLSLYERQQPDHDGQRR